MPTTPALTRESSIEDRAPQIIKVLTKAYPDAHVALNFTNPLECLIATMLSAQCTDERVNMVTKDLFVKYRTPEDYLAVPEDELKEDIRSTGFFNQKARAIRGACARIVEAYDGEVPGTMEELITLPGVARKTANIVQGNSYPKEHAKDPDAGIAVDLSLIHISEPTRPY